MAPGRLIDGVVEFSQGARQEARPRTADLVFQVLQSQWVGWAVVDPAIVRASSDLVRTRLLRSISPTIPDLVGGAYYNLSRHHLAEGLLDTWIVVEQLLDLRPACCRPRDGVPRLPRLSAGPPS
jgi:hypothetical protein